MLEGTEYSSTSEYFEELNTTISKRKKPSKNKRRFNDDQIKSLEVTFEHETKLEPRQKAQLAKDLGLQPRQVAIWFQNKRARWKSKQIEKDYGVLLDNYNNLASQFDSLKKEKQNLLTQLQKLKNEVEGNSEKKTNSSELIQEKKTGNNSSSDGESDNYEKIDFEVKNIASGSLEGMLSDDDSSIKAGFLGLQDEEDDNVLMKMAGDSSLTSAEDWGSLENSDDLINPRNDQSYQWWDFWS